MKKGQTFSVLLAVVLLAGSFFVGVFVGHKQIPEVDKVFGLTNKEDQTIETVDFEPFWLAWNAIDEKFIDKGEEPISNQEKVWGAISGLTDSLNDPYTVFLPPEDAALFSEEISGNFSGVGMEIGIVDDSLSVIAPLKGTPADRSGVKSGDKILQIDGTPSVDFSVDEAVRLIRGEAGTQVSLTFLREGQSLDITITRESIQIPVIASELRPDGIFVISLYSFNALAGEEFRLALREFILSGSDKLIFDLRGNPGGFLEVSVDVASWFLPTGKVIVKEETKNEGEGRVHRSKGYNVISNDVEVVILVDVGSASASEIVAGALQEHGVGKLVGTRTFGKGSVQELFNITSDSSLKLTIAKWLTPNGKSISDGGLTPDVEVPYGQEDFDAGRDPQMEKAVEILLAS